MDYLGGSSRYDDSRLSYDVIKDTRLVVILTMATLYNIPYVSFNQHAKKAPVPVETTPSSTTYGGYNKQPKPPTTKYVLLHGTVI